jgi:dihydrofolate reductase
MGKIVLGMSVSLDGFIEGPNREIDWHMISDDLHTHFNVQLGSKGAFLEGRVTHQLMADFWPTADEDPTRPKPILDFARIWRDTPKYVFSRTIDDTRWNTTVVRDVDPEGIERLKASVDGDLALGGADLAASFLAHDLIDEFRIYVHPVVIGAGKPLFAPGTTTTLALNETRAFDNGVVLLHYERP